MPTRKGRRGSSSCGPPRRFGERSATMTWLVWRFATGAWTTGPTSRGRASSGCRASHLRSARPTRSRRPGSGSMTCGRGGAWGGGGGAWTPLNSPQAEGKNIAFVLSVMRKAGRLLRSWKDGEAKLLGYLEDYAMTADACLAVYEATFDRRWLDEARGLAAGIFPPFWDKEKEVFFDTGADHEQLVVRPRNLFDNAVPCGSSVTGEVLFRLAALTGEEGYESHALRALRPIADLMSR